MNIVYSVPYETISPGLPTYDNPVRADQAHTKTPSRPSSEASPITI